MQSPVKIMCYAINGVGMGHLTRQYAIARQLRRLLHALGRSADIRFLTTSEAPGLVRDFPVYKLPSRSLMSEFDFTAEAKHMISTLLASFRPDILLMDTKAGGSYGEFEYVRDFARLRVFIDRHGENSAQTPMLSKYELLLVPDLPERADDYELPEDFKGRRSFIGPVTLWEGGMDGAELRRSFGLAPDQRVAYVSAGGGGDPKALAQMDFLVSAIARRGYHVLAGYGPLYTGPKRYGPGITPLSEHNLTPYFSGLDLAVSAAGYNTYQELLAAGTPTLFYAQVKNIDRQDRRLLLGAEQNLHGVLTELSEPALDAGLADLAARRERINAALHLRPSALGALRGAYEILARFAQQPGRPLDTLALAVATVGLRHWRGAPEAFAPSQSLRFYCWSYANPPQTLQQLATEALAQLETGPGLELYHELAEAMMDVLRRYRRSKPALKLLEPAFRQLLRQGLAGPERQARAGQLQAWLGLWREPEAPDLCPWVEAAVAAGDLEALPGLCLRLAQRGELAGTLAAWHDADAATRLLLLAET